MIPPRSQGLPPCFCISPAKEGVRKLAISWISIARPSRQLLRSFLRMKGSDNAVKGLPHAEGARRARLEARTAALQLISWQDRKQEMNSVRGGKALVKRPAAIISSACVGVGCARRKRPHPRE